MVSNAAPKDSFPIPLPLRDIQLELPVTTDSLGPSSKLPHEVLLEKELMNDASFWWPFLEPLWNPRNNFTWIIAEQEAVFTAPTILAAFYLGAARLKNQRILVSEHTNTKPYKVNGGSMWTTVDITKLIVGEDSSEFSNTPEDKLFQRAQSCHKTIFRYAREQHQDAKATAHLITEDSDPETVAQTVIDQEKLCRICYLNHTTHRPIWDPRRSGIVDKKKVRKARRRLEVLINLAFEGARKGPQDVDVRISMDFLTELLTIRANLEDYRKKTAEFNHELPNLEASCQNAFQRSSRHMSLADIAAITGLRKDSMNRGILADYLRDRES